MKRFYINICAFAAALMLASFAEGQSRSNRIYRPCSGSSTPASVSLNTAGDVLFTPCSGRKISTPAAASFRFYDADYTPFFTGTNPVSIGSDSVVTVAAANHFTALENNFSLSLSGSSKWAISDKKSLSVTGSPASPVLVMNLNQFFSNGFTPTGTSSVYGTYNLIDIGFPVTTAYGSYTSLMHGGSGAGGAGEMVANYNVVGLGHNGDLTTGVAGRFIAQTSTGSGVTTNGFALQGRLSIRTGTTVTDARGLSLDTWTNTGTIGTSYGIYADSSIDVGAAKYFIYSLSTSPSFLSGKLTFDTTDTAAATTGSQTINKPSFSVNFAAGTSSLVVTNSFVAAGSYVLCTVQTNDATALLKNATPAAGSVTIRLNANATAETRVACLVTN